MANNRTCYLCGKAYSYCPTCGADINKPSWYAMWDNEKCKELDDILVRHTMGKITEAEAKKEIENKDLANVEILNESNKKHLEEIMMAVIEKKEEKVEEKTKEKAEEVVEAATTVPNTYASNATSKMQFKKRK